MVEDTYIFGILTRGEIEAPTPPRLGYKPNCSSGAQGVLSYGHFAFQLPTNILKDGVYETADAWGRIPAGTK